MRVFIAWSGEAATTAGTAALSRARMKRRRTIHDPASMTLDAVIAIAIVRNRYKLKLMLLAFVR
jgi:hypothetical protein